MNENQPSEYGQISWSTHENKILVVHRLSVHPDSQGKGIARIFMNFIKTFAQKEKYLFIRLDAYSENIAALKLYERMGYQRLGQIFIPFKDSTFYCFNKIIQK
ncbi:GNAT family N-acetyltransferase [Oceanispirochaeta crateris]|uniref:GNAT family N-acetyltransferase n=1 Tax=Oceanispirochaeta crateris TaxID=2518645 RepID=UPI001AEF89C3|nr:GNAT family N-acetyltransferase [Oceanispirochaeta crateris]